MTKVENRQLKKGARVAPTSLHPWISLTCSLVVEDGWLEREEVNGFNLIFPIYLCVCVHARECIHEQWCV